MNCGLRRPQQTSPLLYSFVNFTSVLREVLEAVQPGTVCEIGVERPYLQKYLNDFSDQRGQPRPGYVAVDPSLSDEVTQEIQRDGGVVVAAPSSQCLGTLEGPVDLFFVDGDHNYATVIKDLRTIAGRFPNAMMVLHDVAWPTDRRDAYYFPSYLDDEEIHPYTVEKGIRPFEDGLLTEGAFLGSPGYAWAEQYGGERNGVLTAVEDFVESDPNQWRLLTVPGFFGLGLLVREEACTERIDQMYQRLESALGVFGELIETMEYARLRAHCDHHAEASQLRRQTEELAEQNEELRVWADSLKSTTAWKAVAKWLWPSLAK